MANNLGPHQIVNPTPCAASVRKFDTGATRDTDENKLDYEGFLDPHVLRGFAAYMNKHRKQSDGQLRASDNWKKGIPLSEYAKSLIRHTFQFWQLHRGYITRDEKGNLVTMEDALNAILFNTQGYLFELSKGNYPEIPKTSKEYQAPDDPRWMDHCDSMGSK